MFTDDEFEHLMDRIRRELLPRLGDVRREWQSNHDSDQTAEDHMQKLVELFGCLKQRFEDDRSAVEFIGVELKRANDWIGENTSEEKPGKSPRKLDEIEATTEARSSRSIFDDIDAS